MFKELHQIMGKATLSLTITPVGGNELTIGIVPKSEGSEISPVIVTGTPEELDEKFVESISGFIQDSRNFILKKEAAKNSMNDRIKKKAGANEPTVKKANEAAASAKTQTKTETKKEEVKDETSKEPVNQTADLFNDFI